jgi:hypothetical protein
MIGELEDELRKLLRGLDGQTALFLGCFGVLGAQMAWIASRGPLPAPSSLPLFTGLAATFATHSYFSASRGLMQWIRAVDSRLGPGSGWALLESAMLPRGGAGFEPGQSSGAGEFKLRPEAFQTPAPLRRAKRMAWLAPAALGAAALLFSFQSLAAAAAVCGLGSLLSCFEAAYLQRLI